MVKFDESRIKKIVGLSEESKQQEEKKWTPKEIFKKLDEIIIGNSRYKQTLSSCLAGYLDEKVQRDHLIVFGPSGSGKTYLIEKVLPVLGIAYHTIDSSSLVPSGYSGNTLKDSLEDFFKTNVAASKRSIIVMDEFDKISEKSNGGDIHKSHSIQSELLTLIQGKKEGSVDTRNALWIFLGAFGYTDEMKSNPPKIKISDLLKYGFKNELLGRITRDTMTSLPTIEETVNRLVTHPTFLSFFDQLSREGYEVDFEDRAILELAKMGQSPEFGMRAIPRFLGVIKDEIIFSDEYKVGQVEVSYEKFEKIKEQYK